MVIEVLGKHHDGLTTLKEVIYWCGVCKDNSDMIMIRFRKKGNDMSRIRNGVLLRIFDKGVTAYIPIKQIFDNYSNEEAEIIGYFKLMEEIK